MDGVISTVPRTPEWSKHKNLYSLYLSEGLTRFISKVIYDTSSDLKQQFVSFFVRNQSPGHKKVFARSLSTRSVIVISLSIMYYRTFARSSVKMGVQISHLTNK